MIVFCPACGKRLEVPDPAGDEPLSATLEVLRDGSEVHIQFTSYACTECIQALKDRKEVTP